MAEPWVLFALACSFAGYGLYLFSLNRDLVQPNRASWLIWATGTAVEAATYAAVNPGAPQTWIFIGSAVCCIAVMVGLWRRAAWEWPSRSEFICIGAAGVALVTWLFFRNAFWAHMLVIAAVPVSFWPTWASAWRDTDRERSPAWGWWTVGDLATLVVAARGLELGAAQTAYILVELLCHASVWFMIGLATINPWRSLARPAVAARFVVGRNHLGQAVFAAQPFAAGTHLVTFTGPRVRADRAPARLSGRSDRFVQVAVGELMGPSRRIDDLINHSCAPNAGLRFGADRIDLVAIRDIAPGEEVTWDYSTTLAGSDWHMLCQCRAPECRRVIGNFATLSADRQAWFRAQDLIAPYLRAHDRAA